MAAPVLVRAYPSNRASALDTSTTPGKSAQALPPVSSYAFAAILRSSDGPEFQQAIDGIAEICAKNRMSLADEYSSHLPPQGEITAASSANVRPQLLRPGMRRALTSVPEASSGSSEGSRKSKKKKTSGGFFGFRRKEVQTPPMRQMRIGRMGRTLPVSGTTAMAGSLSFPEELDSRLSSNANDSGMDSRLSTRRRSSEAMTSLQQLLNRSRSDPPAENG